MITHDLVSLGFFFFLTLYADTIGGLAVFGDLEMYFADIRELEEDPSASLPTNAEGYGTRVRSTLYRLIKAWTVRIGPL